MTLSEIIAELQVKKTSMESEYAEIEQRLTEVRALAKSGEDLKEKIISIGFAIQRLVDLKEPEPLPVESAWGGIDD